MNFIFNQNLGNYIFVNRSSLFPIVYSILLLFFTKQQDFNPKLITISIFLIILGLFIRLSVMSSANIVRAGGKIQSKKLYVTGMYYLCRNPLYVGNMLIYLGMFLSLNNQSFFIAGTIIWLYLYQIIILTEEKYLAKTYKNKYKIFKKQTNRWIPNIFNLAKCIQSVNFFYKKGFVRDFNVMTSSLLTFFITLMYQNLVNKGFTYNINFTYSNFNFLFIKNYLYILLIILFLFTILNRIKKKYFSKIKKIKTKIHKKRIKKYRMFKPQFRKILTKRYYVNQYFKRSFK
jgi:protein-S-isoprenylcysteine O-methyltransferase Ste14